MKRTFMTIAFAAGLVAFSAPTASAQIFTDRMAYETALGTFRVDAMDGPGSSLAGVSVVSSAGVFSGGLFEDRVVRGGDFTVWTVAGGTYGFGGEWDLAGPGGEGQGLEFTIGWLAGGTSVLGTEIPNSTAGSFWGFISASLMSTISYEGGTQTGVAETYTLDDMTLSAAVVPEPGTWALMAMGLVGLAGFSRRRRA